MTLTPDGAISQNRVFGKQSRGVQVPNAQKKWLETSTCLVSIIFFSRTKPKSPLPFRKAPEEDEATEALVGAPRMASLPVAGLAGLGNLWKTRFGT